MTDGPRFFLDRGLGSRLVPEALRAAGWWLVTMDERYGVDVSQRVSDVQWIAEAAAEGDVLVSKDRNIARVQIEIEAIVASSARMLVLPNSRMSGRQMAERLLAHERAIMRRSAVHGPWLAVVQQSGLQVLSLD